MIWLTVFIYHLIVCEYVLRSVKASCRAKRTVVGSYPVCPRGCTACSRVNGCITCEGRLFIFLVRSNMRETGICTPSCPVGYFGVRHQYYSKCYRCHIEHCHSCFDGNFCTLCQQPYLVSQGQCIERCPDGLYYANYTRECKDRVDCLPGPWSPWTTCSRDGQTCGYKWGSQTRNKQILQDASPNGSPCLQMMSTQRCRLPRRHCPVAKCSGRKKPRRKNKQRRRGHKNNGRRGCSGNRKWQARGNRRTMNTHLRETVRSHRMCAKQGCQLARQCSRHRLLDRGVN